MSLILNEEQQQLQNSARSFVEDHLDLSSLRKARGNATSAQLDKDLYQEMVELGWSAITFPEELGGLGLGFAELGIVLEELGRGLLLTPLVSNVVLAGSVLELSGSDEQKNSIIPGICDGTKLLSLAYQESARHDPYQVATQLTEAASGYVLNGKKQLVLNAGSTDQLIVLARSAGGTQDRDGLSFVLIDTQSTGVIVKNNLLIDGSSVANVHFDNVSVDAGAFIGPAGGAADVLDAVLSRAAIALSAEMVGGMTTAFDMTLEYLKVREQFGAKIGSFQGLKHRAARWFCEVELSKSITLQALRSIDESADDLLKIASVCKARTSNTFHLSGNEGVQMHGGIGVTDEHDIGLYMKRARVCEMLLGDAIYHTSRYAGLSGY